MVENETIRVLSRLGEECVNEARDRSSEESWNDQTGNLRSSIGYTVARNGDAIHTSQFPAVKDGSEGKRKGRAFALEVAKRLSADYGLVVVAGMPYASNVEDMDNKVVLASAELLARGKLPTHLSELSRKLNRKSA